MRVCRGARLAVAGLAVISLSSCGFLGIGPWHGDALNETRHSFETWDSAEGLSIEEMVVSSQSGQPGERETDAIVIGRVVDVEPGQSFSWTIGDDAEARTILPFGDPSAEATSFHLSLEVTDVVVAGRDTDIEPGRIQIGVTHSADKRGSVEDDYQGIGEVVFFLSEKSPSTTTQRICGRSTTTRRSSADSEATARSIFPWSTPTAAQTR